MADLEEGALWLALLGSAQVERSLAKRILHDWCVERGQCALALLALDGDAIAEAVGLARAEAQALKQVRAALPSMRQVLERLASGGVSLLTRADVPYPDTLVERLPESRLPYFFLYAGDLTNLGQPGVSVLGAGEEASGARAAAASLAEDLALAGQHLIGGYDRGVDRDALDAAREVGGRVTAILPLGMEPFAATLKRMEDTRGGATLVLSPYAPDAAPSERLASARLPLVAALAEALYLFAPTHGPDAWPWLTDYRSRGGRLFLWGGAEPGTTPGWLEAGAELFENAAEGRARALRLFGATEQDLGVSDIPLDDPDEEPYDALYSADEALHVLGRGGRVPDALARRLKERGERYGDGDVGEDERQTYEEDVEK